MNFKKMSIITVLAVAQVSTVVPVSAQSSAALEPGAALVQPGENSGTSELQQPLDTQTFDNTGSSIGTDSALTKENAGVPVETPETGQNGASSTEDSSSGQQSNSVTSEESATPNDQVGGNEENTAENPKAEGESESVSAESAGVSAEVATSNSNVLVLMMNSVNMYHNGEHFKAAQPMAVKNGVSYVSIRAMVERAGLKFTYDYNTKETIILKGGHELRFKTDSNKYKVNGESRTMKGPAYQYKNTFMVPLTSITQALGIPYQVNQSEKKVILDLSGLEGESGNSSGGGTNGSDSGGTGSVQPPTMNESGLVLIMNSAKMYHNGKLYTAAQPMAVKNGVSYVAIRSLVNRVGLKLTYDSRTKETVIQRGGDELRFKTDSKIYTVNGVKTAMKGPAYQYKDTFMVPLTSLTQALKIPYRVDQANKRIILELSTKPIASFKVVNKEIFAGQTTVIYRTNAYSPAGLPIVDERWEGREDVFDDPGIHTVTYYVQDSSGKWSDPYSVNITVLVPNEPPIAMFTTDKEEYKMGEKITYFDQSSDDENAIVNWDWDNNAKAFFTPGPATIGLTVTDKHGATSYYEKTIIITNETLYTREEFYQLFADIGEKYMFTGSSVPSMPLVKYSRTSEPRMLIRSNSPETVYREGVVYRETGNGPARFMIHHLNATGKNVKMYVIATNINDTTASLTTEYVGFGGPSIYPNATGKVSVEKYFSSMQSSKDYKTVYLKPGESRVILTQLSALPMEKQQVISLFADVTTDSPVRYDVVMVEENKNPIQKLPFLQLLSSDGIHNRGTYNDSTRLIESDELVGNTPTRIAFGDKTSDPNLTGHDGITGYATSNAGNFGVVYRVKMKRVAPNTLITLNPRGGKYMGAVMVNGNIVGAPNAGGVSAPNEASVLYRTGEYERSVEIWFTAAPGSSLPVNILFSPLPKLKTNE